MFRVREDIRNAQLRDPAARSAIAVWCTYSTLHAVWAHRLHHWMWNQGWYFAARLGSQLVRSWTGVEIHPAAQLGRRLFIDHGMGVVIGATTIVGDDCMLYHGVTLGGTGNGAGRRHPKLGDRVTVGAGAKVLGAISLGNDVKVGANAVVLQDAPSAVTLVGIPARIASRGSIEYQI